MIHVDINPINAFVRDKYLYDLDKSKRGLSPCKIFAISSYAGHVLTCQVLIDNKYIFSYIPLMALTLESNSKEFSIDDCYYNNCPGQKMVVNYHQFLVNKKCFVFKNNKVIKSGKYLFTIDWYDDNLNAHLINTDDGNLILYPSHKLSFDNTNALPQYKKIHKEFILI